MGLGYWDPVTSTIDWCESNYDYTYYIAEYCLFIFFLIVNRVISREYSKQLGFCRSTNIYSMEITKV